MSREYRASVVGLSMVAAALLGPAAVAQSAPGSIVAWGWCDDPDYYQCNVPVPNTGFVALAAGGSQSLALKAHYGDLNCDGDVGFGDINPFVLFLSDFAAWQAAYPDCPPQNGDINGNGSVGFDDINPFVALLAGGY